CVPSNVSAPPSLSPLSLHDALPICPSAISPGHQRRVRTRTPAAQAKAPSSPGPSRTPTATSYQPLQQKPPGTIRKAQLRTGGNRSEEHTSELQSRGHLVCRLLLEKK